MGVMAVWTFRWVRPDDHPDEQRNPTRGFALVEHDFTPRPAYERLQQAAPRIQMRSTGAYEPTPAERTAAEQGQRLELAFAGERLDLLIDPGKTGGELDITVDGKLRESVSIPRGGTTRITVAEGLTDGPHRVTVQIQSEPTDTPPAIEQMIVSRTPIHTWVYPWIFTALIAMTAAVTASLLWGLWRRRPRSLR